MSSRNLSNEITTLKAALNRLLDDLDVAEDYLNNKHPRLATYQIEGVYFLLFKLAEKSKKMRALLAKTYAMQKKSKYPTHRGDLDDE